VDGANQYAIKFRTVTEQPTAVRKARLRTAELPGWLADTFGQVWQYLQRTRRAVAGHPFARYEFHGDSVDVEAGFPVGEPVAGEDRVEPSTLPGGTVAVTTHYGRYDAIEDAYKAVLAWLQRRGYEPAGGHWELYANDPAQEPDPAAWRTDLVVPCRPTGG
jgi:effector-binding domain-containing protein